MERSDEDRLDEQLRVFTKLGGHDACLRLLTSLLDQVQDLHEHASDADLLAQAHRLAGLSGMLGLRALETACRKAERSTRTATAAAEMRKALQHAELLLRRAISTSRQ